MACGQHKHALGRALLQPAGVRWRLTCAVRMPITTANWYSAMRRPRERGSAISLKYT
jgi:hypothetical protein